MSTDNERADTEYELHMAEMIRLGGAHECASDCPQPPPFQRYVAAQGPFTTEAECSCHGKHQHVHFTEPNDG